MSEILKMFTGGFWKFVVSWLLPCIVFLAVCLMTIYPAAKTAAPLREIDNLGTSSDALGVAIFVGIAFSLGSILALNYEPLYRTLEGYRWPLPLFIAGRAAQVSRYGRLARRLNNHKRKQERDEDSTAHRNRAAYHATRTALLMEQLTQYPMYEEDYLPTRFGNAMRSTELYGLRRYSLDSQVFWYELGAAAPEALQEDMQAARGMVDFFVSGTVLAGIYAAVAAAVGIWRNDWRFDLAAGLALIIGRFTYGRATRNVLAVQKVQQAIVNVSRNRLAKYYGLTLPASISEERTMWGALASFVVDADEEAAKVLQTWRTIDDQVDGNHPEVPANSAEAAGGAGDAENAPPVAN